MALDTLELDLHMTVTTMWMLGTKCRSSGRAASGLNQRAISPAPYSYLYVKLEFKIIELNIQLHVYIEGNTNDYK